MLLLYFSSNFVLSTRPSLCFFHVLYVLCFTKLLYSLLLAPLVFIFQLFDRHFALSVPKSRYLPVETTSDLFLLQVNTRSQLEYYLFLNMLLFTCIYNKFLLMQSDLYTFNEGTLTRNTARENPTDPSIELGPVYKNVLLFKALPIVQCSFFFLFLLKKNLEFFIILSSPCLGQWLPWALQVHSQCSWTWQIEGDWWCLVWNWHNS